MVSALLTDRLVTWVLKPLFRRRRPLVAVQRLELQDDYSFPSAHAANGFAFVTAVGRAFPSSRRSSYPLATVIAASRVALGLHHLSDVIGGAALGYGVARGLAKLRRTSRDR